MNVLLTGANGFVGGRLASRLTVNKLLQVSVTYRGLCNIPDACKVFAGTMDSGTDFRAMVENQNVIIHAAARAHQITDQSTDPFSSYYMNNVEITLNLARQAANAGVKRFIFLSTVKVNGEKTSLGKPFRENDVSQPSNNYAISKSEAEKGLLKICSETDLDVVIVRLPLVYGPNVKGNFAILMELVKYGIPLPFGDIHNKRSLIAVDNLVDFVVTCISHRNAGNQIFLVSDGRDLSTPELLRGLAKAAGKPSRLFSFPPQVLNRAARLAGKTGLADRLCGSLQVDISKAKDLLGWHPPVSVDDGLSRCFMHE